MAPARRGGGGRFGGGRRGDDAAVEEPFLLRELRGGELARRARLHDLRARRLDLGRAAAGFQVVEPRLRGLHALLGLQARAAPAFLLEREHGFAGFDRVAAPDVELLELAGGGGGEGGERAFSV